MKHNILCGARQLRIFKDYITQVWRMVSLTNPLRRTHEFTYDGESRLTGHITPMNRQYAYEYDGSGRLTEATLPSDTTITTAYANGRLASVTTPDRAVAFSYDDKGRLSGVSGHGESLSFTYLGDLPLSVAQSGAVSVPHTTTIDYNHFFEPVAVTYAGAEEAMAYDKDGLLIASGDMAILRSAASGRIEGVTDGAITTAYGYTGFAEVAVATTTLGATILAEMALTHHPTNRRIVEKWETLKDTDNAYYSYSYDGLGRLTAVHDGNNLLLESYAYDANDRRVSDAYGRSYVYDDDDRLLSVGDGSAAVAYAYCDDGYMVERTQGAQRTVYDYASTGQLVGVSWQLYDAGLEDWTPDPTAPVITYALDPLGRRIAKTADGVIEEKYLWAGHNMSLLAVYDGSDNLIARFEYGAGRLPVRMVQDNDLYYFAYDQVGSLRGVFDDAGTLVPGIPWNSYASFGTFRIRKFRICPVPKFPAFGP